MTSPNALDEQYLFVYGTLKEGEYNHAWMPSNRRVDVGSCTTEQRYPMVVAPRFGFPFLIHRPGEGEHVEGQLFAVSDEDLELLDVLEGHPTWYRRSQVNISINGDTKQAWVYFLHPSNVTASLLRLPKLKRFSSKGFSRHATPSIDH